MSTFTQLVVARFAFSCSTKPAETAGQDRVTEYTLPVLVPPPPEIVDQGGGLQGLAGKFVSEAGGGQPAEFGVEQGQQFSAGVGNVCPRWLDPLDVHAHGRVL